MEEFEQTPEDGEGQGSLVCYSPGGHRESDTTERLNNNFHLHSACYVKFTKWLKLAYDVNT